MAAAVLSLLVMAGCDSTPPRAPRGPAMQSGGRSGLFDSVADNLDRLEQFDLNQMLPQICDRLNQWYQQEKPKDKWQRDPAVDKLPADVRAMPAISTLDLVQFRLPDGWYLQEAVWLRDIAQSARADQFDDVAVAERLFDWTVRNLQLEVEPGANDAQAIRRRPYEVLLLGRATAQERAWVFMLLARSQGLEAVMLGLDDGQGHVRPWLPALLVKDQLVLFDTRLGLPIPGPGGKGVATLDQVVADEALLRHLDLNAEHLYPVQASDLAHVVAYVEATPQSLSRRMALVESRLAGKHKLVLTSAPGATIDRLGKVPHVEQATLWPLPFEVALAQSKLTQQQMQTIAREMYVYQAIPGLLKGRAMYFKGVYAGRQGAKQQLLTARPSDESIESYKLSPEMARQLKQEAIAQVEAMHTVVMRHAKQSASFWLGLISFDEKNYKTAAEFFDRFTLQAFPQGDWTAAARYNLGRTYEAAGDPQRAIGCYEADTTSPQSYGNRLRAKWLKEEGEAKTKPEAQASDEQAPAGR